MKSQILYLLLLSCLLSVNLLAQQDFITTKNAPKKTKEAFKKAFEDFNAGKIDEAIFKLDKILKKSPNYVNAIQLKADCYINKKNWSKSIETLNTVIKIAPNYDSGIYYTLGQLCMQQEIYVEARKYLEKYLSFESSNESRSNRAKKMLGDAIFRPEALSKPVEFIPVNMGENINTSNREYFPSVTADENTFIFSVQDGIRQMGQEDLYRSLKVNGKWTKSEPLPNVNTKGNEAAQSISADGKFLIFTVCNRPEDFGSCDLYYSERKEGKWTKPKNIGAPINSSGWESQPSVSPNADAIFFTRGGARGQGDKNLMISKRNPDGTWMIPISIDELNTPFDDAAPSIHPDGQTLYFSSEGHPGMGGLDLFMSRLQTDGKWGKPVNLGYPINTAQNEEALSVALSGKIAYIASDRPGGFGSLDIYQFELSENNRPKPVTYVKGTVYNSKNNQILPDTEVEIFDINSSKIFTRSKTDADGEFLLCLPLGKDYSLNVNKQKFLFYSDKFELEESRNMYDPILLKIPLHPLEDILIMNKDSLVSKPIVLKNVFFSTNSSELRVKSFNELDKLKKLLEDNPELKIRINGHTDDQGEESDNLFLSERRAEAVKQYLVKNGVSLGRIEAKGFGESLPIAPNNTEDGRQLNRRTEFIQIK
jgi:flagellar motor protein MotB/tetratricopeptide (TPR) repeat protein